MRLKKNGFYTLCVSLMPGAGEMYMGLYKQGISLMAAFWGILFLGSWMRLEILFAALPVIWCYSFFRTHNLKNMSEEEFFLQEDRFLIFNDIKDTETEIDILLKSHKRFVAGVLIFMGICMLSQICINIFRSLLQDILGEIFWNISRYGAQFMFGLVIIGSGIYLLKGSKKEAEEKTVEQ